MADLELWGGPECTLNRLASGYRDQFAAAGHYDRTDDLATLADLRFAAMRYPVLWEQVAPDDPERCDWTWPDRQLGTLRAQGTRVIAGLVHHGGGPHYTDLLDAGFATGLGVFAGKVAARYDWVRDWTPVNEPLTTARFSALYGHWYPHHRSEASFWLALLNQIDGVRLAMRAVRRVNADARLIQTDDIGRTYATFVLRDQAAFDNVRRWMTWDLLTGRVTRDHPLWERLAGFGLADRLHAIADDPCPPAIVGVNHYLTSDRFLDHRTRRYPRHVRGGSGGMRYADVEAIRVLEPPPPGLAGMVREAWERYAIPIAITEVHNGCTRDEQMRWTADAWDAAVALRADGVRVDAVTAWALFGSAGWNTLLRDTGLYEVGAYDVSGGALRATAMVTLLQGLPGGADRHPVLAGAGWWQRPNRLLHPPTARPAALREHAAAQPRAAFGATPPLLVCGASGTLGQAIARACVHRDIHHVLTSRAELDLADEGSIAAALDRHAPWAVVDAAGWVRVDDAEADPQACRRVNTDGAVALAAACGHRGIPSVHVSSDLVFDGMAGRAYREDDAPTPRNVYGASKADMERGVLALPGSHLVVRTAAFFAAEDDHNFAIAVVRALRGRGTFAAAADEIVSPTYVPQLVDRMLDLAIDGATGLWHLTNDDAVSWAEFARRVAVACGLDATRIVEVTGASLGHVAPRPADASLRSMRGQGLGALDVALRDFADRLARVMPAEQEQVA